jgi:hypothetical protein
MWKDWKDFALVIICGMLLAPFVAHVHRTAKGQSIFAGVVAKSPQTAAPASKVATRPAGPTPLIYQGSAASEHMVTYAYGPAHSAALRCGHHTRTLRWSHDQHSVQVPAGCLIISRPGVGISSGA